MFETRLKLKDIKNVEISDISEDTTVVSGTDTAEQVWIGAMSSIDSDVTIQDMNVDYDIKLEDIKMQNDDINADPIDDNQSYNVNHNNDMIVIYTNENAVSTPADLNSHVEGKGKEKISVPQRDAAVASNSGNLLSLPPGLPQLQLKNNPISYSTSVTADGYNRATHLHTMGDTTGYKQRALSKLPETDNSVHHSDNDHEPQFQRPRLFNSVSTNVGPEGTLKQSSLVSKQTDMDMIIKQQRNQDADSIV